MSIKNPQNETEQRIQDSIRRTLKKVKEREESYIKIDPPPKPKVYVPPPHIHDLPKTWVNNSPTLGVDYHSHCEEGTLASCKGCGQWFYTKSYRSHPDLHLWKPVRWYHFEYNSRIRESRPFQPK